MTDTNDISTIDTTSTIDTYLAGYCEPDATSRAALVAQAWGDDGQLLDPPLDGQGHEALSALAEAVLGHYAGHTFRRTSAVDEHHGFARYSWDLVAPDGSVAVNGTDFAEVGEDGRLRRVVGFFGDLASLDG